MAPSSLLSTTSKKFIGSSSSSSQTAAARLRASSLRRWNVLQRSWNSITTTTTTTTTTTNNNNTPATAATRSGGAAAALLSKLALSNETKLYAARSLTTNLSWTAPAYTTTSTAGAVSSRTFSTTTTTTTTTSALCGDKDRISESGGGSSASFCTAALVEWKRPSLSLRRWQQHQQLISYYSNPHNISTRSFSTQQQQAPPPPPPTSSSKPEKTSSSSTTAPTSSAPPIPPASPLSSGTSSVRYPSSSSSSSSSKEYLPPPQLKPPMPRQLGRVTIPTPSNALPPEVKESSWKKWLKPQKIITFSYNITKTILVTLYKALTQIPYWTYYYATHPTERWARWNDLKEMARHEAQHYWHGTKLLVADVRTARQLLGQTLDGHALTRRERKQLLRTVSDLFRLVPFSMFIIIPFMEFALPFALRLFPNLLPSTFQDSLKAEENMKRELQSRIAMAQFFQETLETLAKEQKKKAVRRRQEWEEQSSSSVAATSNSSGGEEKEKPDDSSSTTSTTTIDKNQEDSAASMLEFLSKARSGEMIPPEVIIRYANYFQDDLTLDNMPRMQLINMCRYMSIPPYGSDSFLRFQLRHKIKSLKEDDQRILWEGIDSLTKMELREAVQERGMRSTGLSKDAYKRALQQWLDLSVNKNVPIALLIMSRTFFLQEEALTPPTTTTTSTSTSSSTSSTSSDSSSSAAPKSSDAKLQESLAPKKKDKKEEKSSIGSGTTSSSKDASVKTGSTTGGDGSSLTGLADAISGLDQEVLNEVILELATSEEKSSDPEIRKLKLAVLEKQNELIRKEQRDREDAKKQAQENKQQESAAVGEATKPESSATSKSSAADIEEKIIEDQYASSPSSSSTANTASSSSSSAAASTSSTSSTSESFDNTLTTEEMDALRTVLSDDPVSSEREALKRIKSAMKNDDMQPDQREELQRLRDSIEGQSASKTAQSGTESKKTKTTASPSLSADPMTPDEADAYVAEQIKDQDNTAASMESETKSPTSSSSSSWSSSSDDNAAEATSEEEDPIVARLKKRVESMVDKIELQLTETQVKIGDKMHFLDKDRDGILTRDEVAEVLQQVLKKKISMEEAMEIASEMDDNHDGIFTVDELLRWIDEHSLVRFVEEGRDVDLDKLMMGTQQAESSNKESGDATSSTTTK